MSEATISFPNLEQLRALFGAQDCNLRQLRDSVGIEVVVRGEELKLHGTDAQVKRGLSVIEELRAIVERNGNLGPADVNRVLGIDGDTESDASAEKPRIDLFEKSKVVEPQTVGQAEYVEAIQKNDLVFCTGPAGSGKTYLAVAMALHALRTDQVRKIVLVRPAVEAGEKLGFLPGDMLAKVNPFLRPLLDALGDMVSYEQVKRYIEHDVVEIVPLAFMRGRTLNDTYMILDEAQNTTTTQMKMFLTRMGTNSKITVTGDTTQLDLPDHMPSGLTDAIKRLHHIEGVEVVKLTNRDIVRHRLVGEIVDAYDSSNGKKKGRR